MENRKTVKKFTCSTCNAGCGLLAEVENNKVLSVKPNPNHPLSKGYCCPKGIALGKIQNDKDRVLKPLKRVGNDFEEISWKQALQDISAKLLDIKNKFSPHSIAYYMGTNSTHQYAHSMFVKGFMDAIGSKNLYNAGSVDNNNKFVAQYFLYGSSTIMTIPDLPKTDLLILIGTNPSQTNLSLACCPNIMKVLKDIKKRGGEIYIIDPLRNETAKILTKENDGFYVPIYPDTDIFLFLSMINIIFNEHLEDEEFLKNNVNNFENLKVLLESFTPERVENVCKISSEKIYEITRKFVNTKKAVIYGRLGTCLSTFCTLNAWAIEILHIISGKLDRPGGAVFGKNVINLTKLGGIIGMGTFDSYRSRIGNYPDVMGAFPLGILAREILTPKNPVKSLFVSGGNPILSAPNSNEFKKALQELDLCVVLDFYINETAYVAADYILPVRTPLENSNIPVYHLNYQIYPHIDYSHPVIYTEQYGPKSEWEILLSLISSMKLITFGNKFLNVIFKIFKFLRKKFNPDILVKIFLFLGQVLEKKFPHLSSGTLSLKKVKKEEIILLGNHDYGVLKNYMRTKDKRIMILNSHLKEQVKLCELNLNKRIKELKTREIGENEVVIIGRRNLKTMNSWMHNIEFMWRNKQEPKLLVNSQDAKRLRLDENEVVILENDFGNIEVPAHLTDDILPGVACYPHGWGHKNPKLSFATQHPGKNINILTNSANLEKLAGMPQLNGYKAFLKKK